MQTTDESSILSFSTKFRRCSKRGQRAGLKNQSLRFDSARRHHGAHRLAVRSGGCEPLRLSSNLSGHPSSGVRLMAGPLALTQDAGVRFAHSRPLAAGAIGSAPRSERGGSRFETWAASQVLCPVRSTERIERYERSDCGSNPQRGTIRPSSNGEGTSLRSSGFQFESGWLDQRGGGRLVRHLIVDQA